MEDGTTAVIVPACGQAAEQLLPLLHEELRKLAALKMAQKPPWPDTLVHEAYVRRVDVSRAERQDSRGHFFAAAAVASRRILVENQPPLEQPGMQIFGKYRRTGGSSFV